jgi:hypothetical protein
LDIGRNFGQQPVITTYKNTTNDLLKHQTLDALNLKKTKWAAGSRQLFWPSKVHKVELLWQNVQKHESYQLFKCIRMLSTF